MRDNLRQFLNNNGQYANGLDADNLMKRIDLDSDGRITYQELCDFLEQGEKSGKHDKFKSQLEENDLA